MTANLSSNASGANDDPVLQWVTFRLAGETYGVNVMQVREVLRYTEIAPVPGAPPYVLGIINLRGNVVTVIDSRVGILVDSVAEVVYLRQSEIETAPNVGNEESAIFIQGVCHKNGELLILIELDKLLTDGEWADMENF